MISITILTTNNMANYSTLKAAIQQVIKDNGNKEITGDLLQQSLLAMVNSLGAGYQFVGIATEETIPEISDKRIFYIAGTGSYPNFGPAIVDVDKIGIFAYDTQWRIYTLSLQISHPVYTNDIINDSDLDISDENNNVLARFSDGHFRVKNFDSQKNNANIGIDSVPDFSENESYAVGSITKYNGLLYKFITDHPAGEWDDADVEQTNIMASATHPVIVEDYDNGDFGIADENGNVLAKIGNKKIQIAGFDSYKDCLGHYYLKGARKKDFQQGKKICLIVGGQSNARGATRTTMPTYLQNALPIQNCNFVENLNFTEQSYIDASTAPFAPFEYGPDRYLNDRWGFDAITYYECCLRALQEIYVIKTSQGDTSIAPTGSGNAHWTADYEELPSGQISLLRYFEKNIKFHRELYGDDFEIRAMIWHQGEGDRDAISRVHYYENLKNLVAYVRGIVGDKTLPFITGTISTLSSQWTPEVQNAQERLSSEDQNFILIDMGAAPLQTQYDTFHFNTESCVYLGQKIYDVLVDLNIINGTKINPIKNW